MARKFSFAAYDRKHLRNLLRRAQYLTDIFGDAAGKAVRIGEATGFCDPEGEFRFDKFPAVKERVDELFKGLHDALVATITEGNREEWLLSAAKNDAMVDSLFGHVARYGEQAKKWKQPNLKALAAFQERKERGMGLSDRVWNLSNQFKSELELALELGLGEGKSAAALSRDVRRYLNEPHKLFHRVRDEKGQLRLSKAAAAYHPGAGIYRSSYKNALRLTATENNMAYRTADHERWQQLDFVIGIEIRMSGNHPVEDICDELAGVYPKKFKFTGWHPFCRCFAMPKLADEDEFLARQQAEIDGADSPQGGYTGEVTEMPEAFSSWVQANAGRIEQAEANGTVPYFIADNRKVVKDILEGKKRDADSSNQNMAIEASAKRVEEVANIIIKNGHHSSREAQMPPMNIGSVPTAITDYAEKDEIPLDSHDLYITTKGIEHTLRESKELKGIAVTVDELVDFVKNRNDYAIYYDTAMGDFIFATSKAKFIVRPNYRMKINKEKRSVFNYISATRISNGPEDAFRYFIKIKDAKQ